MSTPYTNLTPTDYNVGTPISYEDFRAVIQNPQAIAEGADDAPRVAVDAALATTEMDSVKSLHPDGAGGVQWLANSGVPTVIESFESNGTFSMTIPVGTRVRVKVIGAGQAGNNYTFGLGAAGGQSSVSDGTTTVSGAGGGYHAGTSEGGMGITIRAPVTGSVLGGFGMGGVGTEEHGDPGAMRDAVFVMATDTLSIVVGNGGSSGTSGGQDGCVIVEY